MSLRSVIFSFLVSAGLLISNTALSADYKALHELAEEVSLSDAVSSAQKSGELNDFYVLALVYLNDHDAESAGEIFLSINEQDPSFIGARWGLAEVARRNYDYVTAVGVLEEVISEYPEFASAYVSLAYIRYIKMDFTESVRLAAAVARKGINSVDKPNLVRAYGLLAGARGMLAHYGGPLAKIANGRAVMPNLKRAQSISPRAPAVLYGMGSYYLLAPPILGRNYDKAHDYLKQAIEQDPKFTDVYVRLAQTYKAKGYMDKFQEYLDKAFRLDHRNELVLDIKNNICNFICVEAGNE